MSFSTMLLITALISHAAKATFTCQDLGGMSRPGQPSICCKSSCGSCGGSGCSQRPGGASGCCHGHILASNNICGVSGRQAPCQIVPVPTPHPVAPTPKSVSPTLSPTPHPVAPTPAPDFNYVKYTGECEADGLTVEDAFNGGKFTRSEDTSAPDDCRNKCNEEPLCTGYEYYSTVGWYPKLNNQFGYSYYCHIYLATRDANGHLNVLTGANQDAKYRCNIRVEDDFTGGWQCSPTQGECLGLTSARLPMRARYDPVVVNGDLSFTAVMEIDLPDPGSVFAYWDVGSCGPHGDDANSQFCGGATGNPQCQQTITTSACPTGTAHLSKVSGTGTKASYTDANGCDYFYSAEYKCEFEERRWLLNWGQYIHYATMEDFSIILRADGEAQVGWNGLFGEMWTSMHPYLGRTHVTIAVIFDGGMHSSSNSITLVVDQDTYSQDLLFPPSAKPRPTIHIGKVPYGAPSFKKPASDLDWDETIHWFKLYARALSPADVQQIVDAQQIAG